MSYQSKHGSELRDPVGRSAVGFVAGSAKGLNGPDAQVAGAVRRAQAGDEAAIRYLYIRFKDNVYGYVVSFVRDPHEAEDITQQVFLKLMTVIHKYQPREVPFASWLLRVARNVALDHLRAQRLVPCEEVYGPGTAADDAGQDRRRDLQEALGCLPDEQRNVIVLRHLVGLTPGEIAERIGRTEASVHGLHHRARKAIREELAQAGCAPTVRASA